MELMHKSFITRSRVRKLCAEHGYYTNGDCYEYETLLNNSEAVEANDNNVLLIAINIAEHSNIEKLMDTYGVTYKELIEAICSDIFREGVLTLVIVKE